MNKFWVHISNTGIAPGVEENLAKKVRITNQIVFSLSVIASCYLFIFYLLGFKREGIAVVVVVAAMITPIILNYYRFFYLARTWFLIAINGAVLIYSYLFGVDAGIQLVYFSFVCIPWLIFEFQNWKHIVSGILMSVMGYYFTNFYAGHPIVRITPDVQHIIYLSIVVVVFLILSLSMMFFVYQQLLSENFLIHTNKALLESEKQLKERNEKLVEISWMHSHKLRKPVATILGLVQLVNFQKVHDEENKKTLQHLKTAGKELDDIIAEIDSITYTEDM